MLGPKVNVRARVSGLGIRLGLGSGLGSGSDEGVVRVRDRTFPRLRVIFYSYLKCRVIQKTRC